jgi:hypothetical protein
VKSETVRPVTGLAKVKTYSGLTLITDAGEVENPPAKPVTTTVAALESNEATLMPGDTLPAMSVIEPVSESLMFPFVSAVVVNVNRVELC